MNGIATKPMTWAVGFENVAWSRNDPSCETIEVKAVTEKAVQIFNDRKGRTAWFPKSAFEPSTHGTCFVVRQWFRLKITSHQMKTLGYMV